MSSDPADETPTPAPAPRDARGRYRPDVNEPANRFGRRVAMLREAIVDAVSADDIREITVMMVTCAKLGSESAAKLVYQYAIGKPMPANDPDRVDHDEWRLRMERPSTNEMNEGIQQRPPLDIGVKFGRAFDMKNMSEAKEATRQAVEDDVRRMGAEAMTGDDSQGHGPASHGRSSPRTAGESQKPRTGGPA